jgi:hypothetical protein
MPDFYAPAWVGKLLDAGALQDERDLLMSRRRLDLALRSAPPKPDPAVAKQMQQMRRVDAALASSPPPPPPHIRDAMAQQAAAAPPAPMPEADVAAPRQDVTAPTDAQVGPTPLDAQVGPAMPTAAQGTTTPDAPIDQGIAPPTVDWPPRPIMGADGLLHPAGLGGRP